MLLNNLQNSLVIPAKAGIQSCQEFPGFTLKGTRRVTRHSPGSEPGMTKKGALQKSDIKNIAMQPAALPPANNICIGVAYDEAFHFYYQDLFDVLAARGCEVVRFSPLTDSQLPDKIHGLYIGGGYPEVYAKTLSENMNMLSSIRSFASSGRPLYAECGGLMYLSRGIETSEGQRYSLLNILPAWTKMTDRQRALGYVEVRLSCDSLWGKKKDVIRGHEFHYSELIDDPCAERQWNTVYELKRPQSSDVRAEGFQRGNILASYLHLYYAAKTQAVDSFIENCKGGL
jgi:cobyrinic acid a,c-diamide synthase